MEPGVEYGITDFIENQEAYDSLTDEQVQALSRGELVKYGETEAATAAEDSDKSPVVATDTDDGAAKEVAKVEPVIASKDGKHTIPFKELQDAREQARQWEHIANEQKALAESLKAAKAEDAGTGDTKAQDDVMAKFVAEFPELADKLAPAMQKMIDAKVSETVTALEKKFSDAIKPMQKQASENAAEAHYSAIYKAVPDFDAIVEAGAIQAWVEILPSYVKAAAQTVLQQGTATEVIELFSDYKASLPAAAAAAADTGLSKTELAARAAAAVAKAQGKTLTSLTDIPSGTNVEIDSKAAELAMTPTQLFDKFQGKSPEWILKHL